MQPLEQATNVPAFLSKLWKMVNDPATNNIIAWSSSGNSFIIQDKTQFWYKMLPVYYKHNNMSSFVRQLNMYGFHKLSTIDNGTMDIEKDEIQFSHPHFQKDHPELLGLIKRKMVNNHKSNENINQNVIKPDDLEKILASVRQLHGRQNNVDNQLTALSQENALLWRELAIVRQKHIKQQKIVNKLIQFLVTLAHSNSSSRMGVGVKRRMPLMINESPDRKRAMYRNQGNSSRKTAYNKGPTIHEIENPILTDDIFESSDPSNEPIINSPAGSSSQFVPSPASTTMEEDPAQVLDQVEKYSDVGVNDILKPTGTTQLSSPTGTTQFSSPTVDFNSTSQHENVFLNPITRDALISNLSNGSYNSSVLGNAKHDKKVENDGKSRKQNMTVSTRMNNSPSKPSREDLDMHLENSQCEIDSLKDLLNGCTSFDANLLFGLFNDEMPNYGLSFMDDKNGANEGDSLTESMLPTVGSVLDFNELIDDSLDDDIQDNNNPPLLTMDPNANTETINTPLITDKAPFFKDKQ